MGDGVGIYSTEDLLQADPPAVCVVCSRISNGQGIDIKNLSSRSVLTVNNMTEDHFGNYTCVATNRLGMANASVSLIGELLRVKADRVPSGQRWKSVETARVLLLITDVLDAPSR